MLGDKLSNLANSLQFWHVSNAGEGQLSLKLPPAKRGKWFWTGVLLNNVSFSSLLIWSVFDAHCENGAGGLLPPLTMPEFDIRQEIISHRCH